VTTATVVAATPSAVATAIQFEVHVLSTMTRITVVTTITRMSTHPQAVEFSTQPAYSRSPGRMSVSRSRSI
jgi:hypothetical protein